MRIPVIVQPLAQISDSDCAVAAIAMYLGHPYRVVSDAALKVSKRVHRRGLWVSEMLRLVKALGDTAGRAGAASTEDGVVILSQKNGDRHVVVRFGGLIIDPANGCVWDEDTFLAAKGWTIDEVLL